MQTGDNNCVFSNLNNYNVPILPTVENIWGGEKVKSSSESFLIVYNVW